MTRKRVTTKVNKGGSRSVEKSLEKPAEKPKEKKDVN